MQLPDPVKLGKDVAKNVTVLDQLVNEVDSIQVCPISTLCEFLIYRVAFFSY